MQKRWGEKTWQNNHPARTVYDTALGFLKSRKSDTPFYFYLNAEEPHNNIAFFSYDTQDKEVIDEEMRMLEDYVDQLGTNFRGNLIYLLSIRYTDYCIERFCKSLKNLAYGTLLQFFLSLIMAHLTPIGHYIITESIALMMNVTTFRC